MQLLIETTGRVRCIYSDALELHRIGRLAIERASSVEPDEVGHWHADLSSVQGPVLGPYRRRCEALAAEQHWLVGHWLTTSDETKSTAEPGSAGCSRSSLRPT